MNRDKGKARENEENKKQTNNSDFHIILAIEKGM